MAGVLSSFVLAGLLSASSVGFSFDGPEVSARTVGNVGFFTQGAVPFTDLFERGTGSAELSVQDRISDPRATYGDVGRLVATFSIGGDTYRVELDQAGFPPAQVRTGTRVSGPLPGAPAQPIAGGVVLNQEIHGGAALGFSSMSREQAAAAVWGVGRVWRNGALLTDTALIHAAALARGAHADDGTFRVLVTARPGDTELSVLVWNLPAEAEPRGFIQFDFDDVAINVDGVDVPSVAVVPSVGGGPIGGAVSSTTPVPGGASLGAVPSNAQQQQQQGVGGSALAGTGQMGTGAQAGAQPGVAPAPVPGIDGLSDPVRTEQVAPRADITLPGPANQLGGVVEPFLNNPERVSISTQVPSQPDAQTPVFTTTPIVPEAFLSQNNEGRVALNANQPGPAGQPEARLPAPPPSPSVPEVFLNAERMTTTSQQPSATVGGFVPQTQVPQSSTSLSTRGSFSVTSQASGAAGPEFAFGGTRVSSGVVRTPSPGGVQTPAVPLVATPQPLNAQQPVPLVSNPLPLNAQPAVPLISTPPPLNALPTTAPLSGAAAPVAAPGAAAAPGGAAPSP